jgi:hypothetical protein
LTTLRRGHRSGLEGASAFTASICFRAPAGRRKLEAVECKARRDGAAEKRPFAEGFGGLPGMRRNHRLRRFAGGKIGAEAQPDYGTARLGDGEFERRAGIPMPDLGGVDAMPMRALAAREQEIDRSREGAGAVAFSLVAEGLAEMSALGIRLQSQETDDIGGAQRGLAM